MTQKVSGPRPIPSSRRRDSSAPGFAKACAMYQIQLILQIRRRSIASQPRKEEEVCPDPTKSSPNAGKIPVQS